MRADSETRHQDVNAKCMVCESQLRSLEMRLGKFPVSTHLVFEASFQPPKFPLTLTQCGQCALVQLSQAVPSEALLPQVRQHAREPEGHLDDLVQHLVSISPGGIPQTIIGVSAKDLSTLDRLRDLGSSSVRCLDPHEDLGISAPTAYIESVQRELQPCRIQKVASESGGMDLVVARHIFEHAENPRRFIQGLIALLAPSGRIVIEVPDSMNAISVRDYCIVWEEHSMYFSRSTLRSTLELYGLRVVSELFYPRVFESSIVVVCERNTDLNATTYRGPKQEEFDAFDLFVADFADRRIQCRRLLEQYARRGFDVVMFGAGHLASAFIDFYGVSDLIRLVVDDTAEKIGAFLPGSRLRVWASGHRWTTERPTLVLMAVSVESEDVVRGKIRPLLHQGSEFRSILVASSTSLFGE